MKVDVPLNKESKQNRMYMFVNTSVKQILMLLISFVQKFSHQYNFFNEVVLDTSWDYLLWMFFCITDSTCDITYKSENPSHKDCIIREIFLKLYLILKIFSLKHCSIIQLEICPVGRA